MWQLVCTSPLIKGDEYYVKSAMSQPHLIIAEFNLTNMPLNTLLLPFWNNLISCTRINI